LSSNSLPPSDSDARNSTCSGRSTSAFEMYVILDLPPQEVSQRLALHIDNVYRAKQSVTQMLREKLALLVYACTRRAWLVIALSALLTAGCGVYAALHFRIDMLLLPSRIAGLLRDGSPGPASASTEPEKEQSVVLSVPVQLRRVGFGIKVLIDETASPGRAARPDPSLIKLIVRAHLLNSKLAESKITQAETQALADVRAAAADAAIAAAEKILRDTAKANVADDLITQGIAAVQAKLN